MLDEWKYLRKIKLRMSALGEKKVDLVLQPYIFFWVGWPTSL